VIQEGLSGHEQDVFDEILATSNKNQPLGSSEFSMTPQHVPKKG
jgi:hypothetical protein